MPRVLSENTRLLIESLHKPVSLWNRSTKHKLAMLELIGQAREPGVIPDLAPLLLARDKDIAQATARVVSQLGALLSLLNAVDLMLPYISHEISKVRRAAIRSVA